MNAEHVLRKIHDCTFRPKDFLPQFFDPNSPENFLFPLYKIMMTFFLIIDPQITIFSLLFPNFPQQNPLP